MTAIIEHPSPNHSARKVGTRVDTVLLHHTASMHTAGSARHLCDPASRVSAHYLVCTSGAVYRLVPEERKAWHAGKGRLPWETCEPYDFNHRSVGIEVVNPGDGVTPFTEAQYLALGWLVPDICTRLGMTHVLDADDGVIAVLPHRTMIMSRGYLLGHRDTAPGRKFDPADNFDWARIRQALAPSPAVARETRKDGFALEWRDGIRGPCCIPDEGQEHAHACHNHPASRDTAPKVG